MKVGWQVVVDGLVSAAMLVAAATIVWTNTRPAHLRSSPANSLAVGGVVSTGGSPVMGDTGAAVTIVEFSDFRCPFCRKFALDTLPPLVREFVATARAKIVFKHLPLKIHTDAISLATAAACAGQQGLFWQWHDRVFQSGTAVVGSDVASIATDLGADAGMYRICLDGDTAAGRVQSDMDEASRLGITSTPTFLLGLAKEDGTMRVSTVLTGYQTIDTFRKAIEALPK